ncbi:hypothetical protein ACELLULO517_02630 [Acidisoma cellulosilytica]|uniref:Uncharacterized protein n=1 Tax=Acidisoma cellulosilyticum TaxID=2802395 RepID=A0A963YY56_9PROT|nr:hypothetical protein [Acidisoma cellulosilyticum]MCB8879115.1 hypothetical protein [Acidisoma cellulosilyticum]
MKHSKGRRFYGRRSSSAAPTGRRIACLVLLAAVGIPTAAVAAMVPTGPQTPGPASPVQTPPALSHQTPHNGVITPPTGISRMPVIKPKVPTRTPVIPPAGSPGGSQTLVPK